MSDLQCTEQRAASGTTLPSNEVSDRFFHAQPHAADLLDEEFAAAGGAFVM